MRTSSERGKPLLEVENLNKSFFQSWGEVQVLRGLDLTLQTGIMLAVVGESGVGKSTLLQILGALERPTSGTVYFEGQELFRMGDAELARFRNRKVGFIFQFHHLLPEFTALENVMMPALLGGRSWKEARQRAQELLAEVGLSERLFHRPGELSGGEQQRVAVARALINDPQLVLADEPTGNLDSKTSEAIQRLLRELNLNKGLTFVVVTHNEVLAHKMDRIVRLFDGKAVAVP